MRPLLRHLTRSLVSLVLLSLFAPTRALGAQGSTSTEPLVGFWGGRILPNEQLEGEAMLERTGRRWTLRVSGFEGAAEQRGDSVVIRLPGDVGTLRAWVSGTSLHGFWVQPAVFDRPSYASPVKFHAVGATRWSGDVRPLKPSFLVYLLISRAADSQLSGIFRNPDANWPGRAGVMPITREGNQVAFTNRRTGKVQWRQPFDSANRTIEFDFGMPLVLSPAESSTAVGFQPRIGELAPYEYRPPVARRDGWRTARARDVGVDEAALRSVVRALLATDPTSDTVPRVHSITIARRGQLILDEYFFGYAPDRLHDLRSASKTMTSVMAGAAMLRGANIRMSSPIDTAARLRGITVGHLLTHSSGLACDDDDSASPGNEDTMQSQTGTDWYAYTLALARVQPAGSSYSYCSGGINLVGRQVGLATGQWLPRFFDAAVAEPLGISHYAINLMPSGEAYSGGGMQLEPRDFLKFGQLYLDGGVWNGRRVVSAQWVAQSTAHQIDRPDGSDDGFGWHRHRLDVGRRTLQTYEAGGNGGQLVIVIPELQMTVAFTAGNYGQYAVWQKLRTVLVPELLGAVK